MNAILHVLGAVCLVALIAWALATIAAIGWICIAALIQRPKRDRFAAIRNADEADIRAAFDEITADFQETR